MTTAISFEHVSKKFTLNRQRARSFQELALGLFRRGDANSQESIIAGKDSGDDADEFWALRDVSFTVEEGETVGLIGPNGAGKSTALKLVSRIIEPTSGRVEVNGRLGALLELGAGFHPDLTGRENIYLNGSILGLSRAEIKQRLDQIIAFAELERFIDAPLKHYSSGMRVRLGFSVAVHIDPEILLLDEVLAVGDQVFQQKSLQRIRELKETGITIVMASHNLASVGNFCEQVVWLDEGEIQSQGNVANIVDDYAAFYNEEYYRQLQVAQSIADEQQEDRKGKEEKTRRWGTFNVEITKVELLDENGSSPRFFESGEYFHLRIHYRTNNRIDEPTFGMAFYRNDGVHVNGPNSVRDGYEVPYIDGKGYTDYIIESLPLNPGHYEITVAIYNRNSTVAHDHHHRAYSFEVRSPATWHEEGVVHIPAKWRHIAHTNGHSPTE